MESRIIMKMSVKAMIFNQGKLLLLQKNDREGLHPWEFPGGGVQMGEDFEEALIREVREETGLTIHLVSVDGIWCYKRSPEQQLDGVIFTAETDRTDVVLSDEHLQYRWVTPELFQQYPLHDSLRQALARMRQFDNIRGDQLQRSFFAQVRGN